MDPRDELQAIWEERSRPFRDRIRTSPRLDDLTRQLYVQFDGGVCDPSWADQSIEMEKAATSKNLRQFTDDEVEYLAWHAQCFDSGIAASLQFFLPRLLQSLAMGKKPFNGLGMFDGDFLVKNLRICHWRSWPGEQIALLESWFTAWFHATLTTFVDPAGMYLGVTPDGRFPRPQDEQHTSVDPGGIYLCFIPTGCFACEALKLIAFAGMDVEPMLDYWRDDASLEAAGQLALFIHRCCRCHSPPDMLGWAHLWGLEDDGVEPLVEKRVYTWLLSAATKRQLTAAFHRCGDQVRLAKIVSDAETFIPPGAP